MRIFDGLRGHVFVAETVGGGILSNGEDYRMGLKVGVAHVE